VRSWVRKRFHLGPWGKVTSCKAYRGAEVLADHKKSILNKGGKEVAFTCILEGVQLSPTVESEDALECCIGKKK